MLTPTCLFLSLIALQPPEKPLQDVPDPGAFKIEVDVSQTFLSVSVRAPGGGFYRGLTRQDFQVLEDDVPQEIINFAFESVPVKVVLLIDASGSTSMSQASIRRAARRFAEALGAEDRIAIITFNHAVKLILEWTNELENVDLALASIYAKGSTVLHDALYVTFDDLLADESGKRAVLLLTDGVDQGSMVSFEEAFDLAVRSEALVYVASKLDEYRANAIAGRHLFRSRGQLVPEALKDGYIVKMKGQLERIAQLTGGVVLEAQAFSSLTEVFRTVADELKNQYYLSYVPTNKARDGNWRKVTVRVRRPGVVARTRPGYFAPSP